MIIKTKNTSYECSRAERHGVDIYLYTEESKQVTILEDPAIIEVIGGEISVVEADSLTQLDIIEAQVTYTAMMTDTLLEV